MVQIVEEEEPSDQKDESPTIQEQIDKLAQAQEDMTREMREIKEILAALVAQGAVQSAVVLAKQSMEESQGAAQRPMVAEPRVWPRNVSFEHTATLPS